MKLKEYLKSKKTTMQEFANFVGLSRSHLYLISEGARRPGKAAIQIISFATLGMVNEEDYAPKIKDEEDLE